MKLSIQWSFFGLVQHSLSPQNNKARATKTLHNCQDYSYSYIDLTLVKYQKKSKIWIKLGNTLVN